MQKKFASSWQQRNLKLLIHVSIFPKRTKATVLKPNIHVYIFTAQNMGWTSGDTSNLVGWAGSNGTATGNSHGWVDENQGSSSPGGSAGQTVMTAADLAAEAAKAEGRVRTKPVFSCMGTE